MIKINKIDEKSNYRCFLYYKSTMIGEIDTELSLLDALLQIKNERPEPNAYHLKIYDMNDDINTDTVSTRKIFISETGRIHQNSLPTGLFDKYSYYLHEIVGF